jgi:hypothetical protein
MGDLAGGHDLTAGGPPAVRMNWCERPVLAVGSRGRVADMLHTITAAAERLNHVWDIL